MKSPSIEESLTLNGEASGGDPSQKWGQKNDRNWALLIDWIQYQVNGFQISDYSTAISYQVFQ
jgi:hypothetical protein